MVNQHLYLNAANLQDNPYLNLQKFINPSQFLAVLQYFILNPHPIILDAHHNLLLQHSTPVPLSLLLDPPHTIPDSHRHPAILNPPHAILDSHQRPALLNHPHTIQDSHQRPAILNHPPIILDSHQHPAFLNHPPTIQDARFNRLLPHISLSHPLTIQDAQLNLLPLHTILSHPPTILFLDQGVATVLPTDQARIYHLTIIQEVAEGKGQKFQQFSQLVDVDADLLLLIDDN